MDFFTVICIILWLWGAYKGWGIISETTWEWLQWINKKELLYYVIKGAACIVLGFVFVVIQICKLAMRIVRLMF